MCYHINLTRAGEKEERGRRSAHYTVAKAAVERAKPSSTCAASMAVVGMGAGAPGAAATAAVRRGGRDGSAAGRRGSSGGGKTLLLQLPPSRPSMPVQPTVPVQPDDGAAIGAVSCCIKLLQARLSGRLATGV